MIKHFLFREKPRVVLQQQRHYPVQPWAPPLPPKIQTQVELDEFWKENPIAIPTFIKWGSNRALNDKSDIASVAAIVGKCMDVRKLTYSYRKEPETILIFNCSPWAQLPARWESLGNWVPITHEEFKLLIEPIYADVSAKIQHWQEVEKDRLTGPSASPLQCGDGGGETCDIPTFPESQPLQGEHKGS